ncbi:Lin0512 family protein [Sulfitobacter mediterraneus]|jgi:uncharacterized protein (TIGR02058 family)|uniref:Uncharacterized protein n=1 Tax=Sulfitobacter mediterraneus TaxID=83219 RepID=A0A061ST34_9RHOB|nr:Lin0512 family protein [Sulfitobacter mediterraneus]KAJ04866.1 hypothetical protein PM02_01250 [Sulfitobacter mediterraneus]MBM1557264.1 Lin0512 family protein [Sulfitobacter mediterraneus]MBM1568310.1 Lin0512 family protein [Sulfitobacter mediterraneus]MBM1572087.1 Lin0512 family protein [Sulfitobacter mediterraneus]MBM1575876.1 Lin0512 family protein [Sulfitobacter mediterraneus]
MRNTKDHQRVIIEMGMGNDLHGMDYTKAAARAIEDAFRHSSLPIFGVTGLDHADMRVQVTVAVQEPDKLDLDVLTAKLPRGKAEVTAVFGGLNVPAGGETIVIAQASVEAFLPPQTGWKIKG